MKTRKQAKALADKGVPPTPPQELPQTRRGRPSRSTSVEPHPSSRPTGVKKPAAKAQKPSKGRKAKTEASTANTVIPQTQNDVTTTQSDTDRNDQSDEFSSRAQSALPEDVIMEENEEDREEDEIMEDEDVEEDTDVVMDEDERDRVRRSILRDLMPQPSPLGRLETRPMSQEHGEESRFLQTPYGPAPIAVRNPQDAHARASIPQIAYSSAMDIVHERAGPLSDLDRSPPADRPNRDGNDEANSFNSVADRQTIESATGSTLPGASSETSLLFENILKETHHFTPSWHGRPALQPSVRSVSNSPEASPPQAPNHHAATLPPSCIGPPCNSPSRVSL
ncbi:uncharacterized protein KY384_007276 [Bacidia gigantensis]|uniref:uncharacterized protein n=1 Tax=Bacidia gigantensis TaxID=2732470 RepID=UPI001D040A5A|nr:uncharacterized protein KY384_007276 [Bacidia gigantensis]KAG8528358.1 hypothetical protein KY384_007276 [Bacidia gigantensis]